MFQLALGLVYSVLLIFTIYCLLVKPKAFVFYLILLMFVSPTAQYLVYNGTGENYFTTTPQRLVLELINIALIIGFWIRQKVKVITSSGYINLFYGILFLWNFLHLFNIVLSLDSQRSLLFYLISVLGPSLFSVLIINVNSNFLPIKKLPTIVFRFSVFFFSIGILSVLYQVLKVGAYVPLLMRTAGGMYLSNFSIALMSLFFPFLFLPFRLGRWDTYAKYGTALATVLELLQALSRAGFGLYGLYFLYNKIKSPASFVGSVLLIVILFFGVDAVVQKYTKLSFVDAIEHRFTGYGGDATSAALDDERLHLYFFAYEILSSNPHWIPFGVGIGNYRLLSDHVVMETKRNKKSLSYSNAHNLFLNNLIERGVLILATLLSLLVTIFVIGRRILRLTDKDTEEYHIYRAHFHGILLFILIASFNMDLFVAAAYQNGLAAYMLLFSSSILIKGYLFKSQNQKSNIKTIS